MKKEHLKVLLALGDSLSDGGRADGFYVPFQPVIKRTFFSRSEVRRIIRLLKRKGLTEFCSGLSDHDGELRGSGYRPTEEGWKIIDEMNPTQS